MLPLLAIACSTPDSAATPEPAVPVVAPIHANVLDPHATDLKPGRRTLSPSGAWELVVKPGGALVSRRTGSSGFATGTTDEAAIDEDVDPRLLIAPDDSFVIYSREGLWGTSDLWMVTLPDGTPTQLTAWPDSEDRPVLSPDGRRVAFVSGATGIASWWVIDLPADGAIVPPDAGRQVTNIGVRRGKPGEPPAGFVPVPDGTTYRWTATGLEWVSEGQRFTADVQ